MSAYISLIEYCLPDMLLTNEMISSEFPEWPVEKIEKKTGIRTRRIAAPDECASDLGVRAAEKIFAINSSVRDKIDYILFCTQSPDYFLPTTACLIQSRLNISKKCGAIDFNLGCSGYIYGLGLAKGLVETSQANNILLITADTYSKYINKKDKSVRTIFGDAATATLVQNLDFNEDVIGPFVYGTDGSGWKNLIVQTGGSRHPHGNSGNWLHMNGPEILLFTLNVVPDIVKQILHVSGKHIENIDLFVFHQANEFILKQLQKKINIPQDKFFISLREYGNTVSSSIPIALNDAYIQGKLKNEHTVMLVGFGVGYSTSATIIKWKK